MVEPLLWPEHPCRLRVSWLEVLVALQCVPSPGAKAVKDVSTCQGCLGRAVLGASSAGCEAQLQVAVILCTWQWAIEGGTVW